VGIFIDFIKIEIKNDLRGRNTYLNHMPYVKPKIAREQLGVTNDTLRRWEKEGKIKSTRIGSGCRLYDISSITPTDLIKPTKRSIIYCRVSSSKQKEDLERQITFLGSKYPTHEVVKEIASGINFKRKALQSILDASLQGLVKEVVVAHRDRLCRIAFEHFQWLFNHLGVNLIVDGEEDYSVESELANDLMSIVHVFSCRHYGARRNYTTHHPEEGSSKETTKTIRYENGEEKEGG
jgi:putative resolvase